MEQKTQMVRFRMDNEAVNRIKQEAERKGMTLTTFIRDAIRDKV